MTTEPIPPQSDEIPPPSEEVHLPGPSYLPVWTAFGLMVALVGILLSWVIAALGALIALFCIVRWVRDARQEISDLPLGH